MDVLACCLQRISDFEENGERMSHRRRTHRLALCGAWLLLVACPAAPPDVLDGGPDLGADAGAPSLDASVTGPDAGLDAGFDGGSDAGLGDAGQPCRAPPPQSPFELRRRPLEAEALAAASPLSGAAPSKSLELSRVLPHSWLDHAQQHIATGRVSTWATLDFELFDGPPSFEQLAVELNGVRARAAGGVDGGAERCTWRRYAAVVPATALRFRIEDDRTTTFATPSGAQVPSPLSSEDGRNTLTVRLIDGGVATLGHARLSTFVQAPLVLIHGVNDNQMMWQDWLTELRALGYLADASLDLSAAGATTAKDRPDERLKADGRLAHNDSVEHNAAKLQAHLEALAQRWGSRDVHLVAHSKGGLDAVAFLRTFFEDPGPAGTALRERVNVLSLSTFGSPFAGSAAIDVQLALIDGAYRFARSWRTVTAGGSTSLPHVCGGTLSVFPWAWQTLEVDPWALSCSQPATSWSSWGRYFSDDDGVDEFLYSAVSAVGTGGSIRGPGLFSLRTARRDGTAWQPTDGLFTFGGWRRTSPPMANVSPVWAPDLSALLDWTNPRGVAFFGYAADADFRRSGTSDCRRGTGSGLYGCIDNDEEADLWGPGPSRLVGWDTPWSYWVASQTWASTYMYRFMGRVGGVDASRRLVTALGYDYVRLDTRPFDFTSRAVSPGTDPCALVAVAGERWQPNDLAVTCDSARHPLMRQASATAGFTHYQGEAPHRAAFKRVTGFGSTVPAQTSTCPSQGANHISMMRAGHVCKLHAALGRLEDTFGLVPFFGEDAGVPQRYADPLVPSSYVDVPAR